jgi:hypothetical protein
MFVGLNDDEYSRVITREEATETAATLGTVYREVVNSDKGQVDAIIQELVHFLDGKDFEGFWSTKLGEYIF